MNEDLHVPCPACPRRFRAAGDLLAHCRGCHPKYKFTEDQQRAYSCYHCEACKLPFSRYTDPEGHRHAANCRGVPADTHAPTPARTRDQPWDVPDRRACPHLPRAGSPPCHSPPTLPSAPPPPSQRAVLPDVSRTAISADPRVDSHMRDLTEADLVSDTQVDPKPASDAPPSLEAPYPDSTPAGSRSAEVSAARFEAILRNLTQGSAAGPSGWTYEHVRSAGLYNERTGEAMRRFVNLLLSGTIPHSDPLLASRLIAIAKPNGGVRPLAIGEVFMRLAGIYALACVPEAPGLLAPHQIGVGVRGGPEIPSHALAPDF
eukprot:jgi/Ulvmu1/8677/UM047_0015.1